MKYQTIIDAESLSKHLHDGWLIVDCRFNLADTEEGRTLYHKSHIPGSYYAHLDQDLSGVVIKGKTGRHPLPDLEDFYQLIQRWGLSKDQQVVVYDQGHGGIAARLWWMLSWLGHEKVAVLEGGWNNWINQGYPVSESIPADGDSSYRPLPDYSRIFNADKVENIITDSEHILIDSRASNRYLGIEEPIDPVAGHIESAVNRPFLDNLTQAGNWKSVEQLTEEFKKYTDSYDPDKTVFYCGSGVTACHNLLTYKHITGADARLYPGSWSEWLHRLSQ